MRIIVYLWQNIFRLVFNKNYWGFVNGHHYLSKNDYDEFTNSITSPENNIRAQYEEIFSSYIGDGQCLSFASARMAFYTLLKTFKVKEGDEVIITGFTCSVMVNAIIRTGATPVYSDIEPDTFGSNALDIKKKITNNTKVIVAQHSFGIPCKIDLIKQIAIDNNIFLIEDCALAFCSRYKGVTLGNWGHAAIFSTDHSKPLNTLIGGILYTLDSSIYNEAKFIYNASPELTVSHQKNILMQIKSEAKYCNPSKYSFYKLLFVYEFLKEKVFKEKAIFLSDDSYATIKSTPLYTYPSKMPVFLCKLGIMELARFEANKTRRLNLLKKYIELVLSKKEDKYVLPNCYFDVDSEIVPLRFVFESKDVDLEKKLSKIIDTSWFWFKQPIIATTDKLSEFGYVEGNCPISELVGSRIINFPCILENDKIIENLKTVV